ncbi:MAG: amino acid-binding protein [Thermoleophilia bacterium]|nr:amino acid-binding protein [Thermoleophilia bacterium]
MNQFAIAAMGGDQPGIVAAVGEALLALGANIDDSSMTILGGQFAMLLIVNVDESREALESALASVAARFGLQVEVSDADARTFSDEDRDDYVVAAYGPDRAGLVSTISRVLADVHANITDFGSRLGADHTFAMWFNVSLVEGTDIEALRASLSDASRDLGLDVRLYQAEAEQL